MSRQPPLPPGYPPRHTDRSRPDSRNMSRQYEQDRDEYYDNRSRDRYQAERPRSPPPPPVYEFRGAIHESRPASDDRRYPTRYEDRAPGVSASRSFPIDNYRRQEDPPNSFTFRHEPPSSVNFHAADNYRRSPPRQRPRRENGSQPRSHQAQRGRGGYRGRGGSRLASEREFLQGNRAPTPELMQGMDDTNRPAVRYKPIDDVSDSEEAEMDLSNDDGFDARKPKTKQARTGARAADGDSAPKWSNPDPYTALPPPDAEKKKDMVKLIRKARIATGSEGANKTTAISDDFISFDFGDDAEDDYSRVVTPAILNAKGNANTNGIRSYQSDNDHPQGRFNQVTSFEPAPAPSGSYKIAQVNGSYNVTPPVDLAENIPPDGRQPGVGRAPAAIETRFGDPSLGSRKRNARDEIKPAPRIHDTTRGRKAPAGGHIVRQWQAKNAASATPWVEIDHSDTVSMGFWLHKEIMDFYHFVKPRAFEQVIREKLIDDLNQRVMHDFHAAEVLSFGSFPAGLYLPTADMDLVMVSDEFMRSGRKLYGGNRNFFDRFSRFLQQSNLPAHRSLEVIAKARVPLVKYVDKLTGLKVDISFENDTGLIANKTFQDWKAQYPAMPMIVTVIKHLLAMRGLNEPVNGGIGGFSVICLVVSLLQHMPQVQSRSMLPEHHLGEVLMEFFNLYGNEFNTMTTGIQLKPPGYFSKAQSNIPYKGASEKFMIIDPNNSHNDISGGSSNSKAILKCFSDSYKSLQETMAKLKYSPNRRGESILGCILGGNYESFKLQREHLRHVHEKLIGPV